MVDGLGLGGEQPVQLGQVADLGGAGRGQLGEELAPHGAEEPLDLALGLGRPGWLCTSLIPRRAHARSSHASTNADPLST
jgi:hypothetical protein